MQYLIDNDLASTIRIVDKVLPALAYLNKIHDESFKNPIVEFVNANLLNKSVYFSVSTKRNYRTFDYNFIFDLQIRLKKLFKTKHLLIM